jgi:PncC family amidohydrolase
MFLMQRIILQIHKRLIQDKKTLAVAESCTGGMLSSMLTQEPGSSNFFTLGLVVYSNQAKNILLGVPRALIARKGAVSKAVALRMSRSVRRLSKTDFGIGITGIAGPGGKTPSKPVGTVYIAVDAPGAAICRKFRLRGDRSRIRKTACLEALRLLNKVL